MLSIESLLLTTFTFFEKLFYTMFSIGFRTKGFFDDIYLDRTTKYLNSKIYFTIGLLLFFTLYKNQTVWNLSGSSSILGIYSFLSANIVEYTSLLIFVMPVALFMYLLVYGVAVSYKFSEQKFPIFLDYALYWLGTYFFGWVAGSVVLLTLLLIVKINPFDIPVQIPFFSALFYFLFFTIRPLTGLSILGRFSGTWLKFGSIIIALPLVIITTGFIIFPLVSEKEKIDSKIENDEFMKGPLTFISPESTDGTLVYEIMAPDSNHREQRIKVNVKVVNSKAKKYLLNTINIEEDGDGWEDFAFRFKIEHPVVIEENGMTDFTISTEISQLEINAISNAHIEHDGAISAFVQYSLLELPEKNKEFHFTNVLLQKKP